LKVLVLKKRQLMKNKKPTHTDASSPLFGRGFGGGLSFSPPSEGSGEAFGAGGGSYRYVEIQLEGPVVRIKLNRPARHNAIVPEMLLELNQALDEISAWDEPLFVILSGNGPSFCAGADLNWFYSSEQLSLEQNTERYRHLADLLLKIYRLPQITVAVVHGNVFGGGIGLMAACDFVLAEVNTRFMFSEVKLGLLPATILPFVAKRLSVQNLRKWVLTGALFSVSEAHEAGLIDILCQAGEIETGLTEFLASFDQAVPSAVKKAKQLINRVASGEIDVADTTTTSAILAEALLSRDGQEGIHAFLEKREKPL
jgi:methylglutaconyl-CoA hydratase